ncbi:BcepGomrgp66 [Burkholderia phage BcepGomr]|nr:BcepGomrgp66 [Burkholderia phage BcepGomr]ABP63637.1 BcepGomrgp66 [Burkholderia phage BcepGomr]
MDFYEMRDEYANDLASGRMSYEGLRLIVRNKRLPLLRRAAAKAVMMGY